jgi:hypothetical protein
MTYSIVGTIYKPTGVILTDNDGNEYPEMEAVEGYHVNALDLSIEDMEKLQDYIVDVNTPSVVFAGRNDTVCLKFATRDEWLDLGYEIVEVIE